MKNLLSYVFITLIVGLCFFNNSSSYAQQKQPITQEFRLNEGTNHIQIAKGKGTLRFMYRNGTFSNVTITTPAGKVFRFKSATDNNSANGSDCPCGMTCHEDEDNQQSICFCVECQGGKGSPSMFRLYGDNDGSD